MGIKAVDNKTGEQHFFEVKGCEILIGSDPSCDVVLAGEGVFPQHARLAQVSHHLFLRTERDERGIISPFHIDEPGEHGNYMNWKDADTRIDSREFPVGHYTVCRY